MTRKTIENCTLAQTVHICAGTYLRHPELPRMCSFRSRVDVFFPQVLASPALDDHPLHGVPPNQTVGKHPVGPIFEQHLVTCMNGYSTREWNCRINRETLPSSDGAFSSSVLDVRLRALSKECRRPLEGISAGHPRHVMTGSVRPQVYTS